MPRGNTKKASTKNAYKMDPVEAHELVEALTPRERQVAELIAMGLPQVDIAKELGISTKTLDIHRGEVRQKFSTTTHGIARVWFCALTSTR